MTLISLIAIKINAFMINLFRCVFCAFLRRRDDYEKGVIKLRPL